MARALCEQARYIAANRDVQRIGLAGGVFQNRALTDQVLRRLEARGYEVTTSLSLACNDAAISFGQLAEWAAAANDRVG